VPQLAAAAIALALASGALSWSLAPRLTAPETVPSVGAAAVNMVAALEFAPELSTEIKELEDAMTEYRDRLQPETIRTVERNLEVIDRAIVESFQALEADPANPFLRSHVEGALKRKVEFLRGVSQITGRAL